eukprot:tig00022075_g23639.t1
MLHTRSVTGAGPSFTRQNRIALVPVGVPVTSPAFLSRRPAQRGPIDVVCTRTLERDALDGASDEPTTAPLFRWLEGEGVDLGRIRVGSEEGVRGLFATQDIGKGQRILELPERLLINEDTVRASVLSPLLDDFDERVALAVFILHERQRRDSVWQPYIASLPRRIGSPLFWEDEELELLRGSRAYGDALQLRDYVAAMAGSVLARAAQLAPALASCTPADLRWALSVVFTRAVRLLRWEEDLPGGETGQMWNRLSLCPALDLLNHSPADAAHTQWEIASEEGPGARRTLRLEASAPIRAGEQVRLCYGALSSAQTLVGYGFVIAGNTDEFSTVRLPPMPSSDTTSLRDEKIDALLSLGIDWDAEGDARPGHRTGDGPGPVYAVYADGSVPEDLIAAANIAAARGEAELEALWQDAYELNAAGARFLEAACTQRLEEFPDMPPPGEGAPEAARQAAVVRQGERRAITNLLVSLELVQ